MMKVQVQLRGPLQKYGKSAGYFEWETAAETCIVEQLISELGLPASAISFVSVNGTKESLSYLLKGGERVVVYPQVAGG
jgi:molybdopterin converting factor small subunit